MPTPSVTSGCSRGNTVSPSGWWPGILCASTRDAPSWDCSPGWTAPATRCSRRAPIRRMRCGAGPAPRGSPVHGRTRRTRLDFGYPRPQLQRANWTCLNGSWRFRYDDEMTFTRPQDIDRWPQQITIPYPPESRASGIADQGFHKVSWYQRDIDVKPGKDRVILRFGAVDYSARVWVNGLLAATHEGGHTPFSADITDMLDPSGRQVVTVRAEDDPHELTKPRGKQDWQLEPHSIWYPRTTGIWQTVWLELVPATAVRAVTFTPHLARWEIGFEVRIRGDHADDLAVEIELSHGER